MSFETMARKHWTKYCPALTKELKAQGIFENEIKEAARMAREQLSYLVNHGAQLEAAKEIVLNDYIFLPPETKE